MKISMLGYTTSLHRYYLEKYLKVVLPRLGGPILDVGSKSRRYDSLLPETPVAIDLVENKAHDIEKGDVNELQFEDQSFRSVVCIEVLEYVEDPNHALGELSRVVSKGGTLVLSMPFMYRAHDDKVRYTGAYLKEKIAPLFSHVECAPIGNFYTVLLDVLMGKIRGLSFPLLRYALYLLATPLLVGIPLSFLSKDERYASGYCIVAIK